MEWDHAVILPGQSNNPDFVENQKNIENIGKEISKPGQDVIKSYVG